MASPTDSARQGTNITTASTSHAINVGSPAAETLLIVWVRFAAAPGTVTFTGYTSLASDTSDASDDTSQVFYRWADGAEGATDTLTTGNSVKLAAICWEVTGAENPAFNAPNISTVAVGTTTANTADSGSVAPVGAPKDTLYISMAAGDGEVGAYTGAPASYANLATANSSTGGQPATNCFIGGASRQISASSSDNPGAFTHGAHTTGWTAYTVAIRDPQPVSETPTFGGATAGGASATGLVGVSVGGGTSAGATPLPVVINVAGGALGAGSSASAQVAAAPGASTAAGNEPTAVAPLSAGGALAGGVAPTEDIGGGGITETPTFGGALASGAAPIVHTILTVNGAVAVGLGATALVLVAQTGATAGGVAPVEAFPGAAVSIRNFDQPKPPPVLFDAPIPIGQVS